jgi:hypothetical protein
MQENIIFRDERNEPGSVIDWVVGPLVDIADHLGGIGNEDEKITPLNIHGNVVGHLAGTTGNDATTFTGYICAITHIGTVSEGSGAINNTTQTDLYTMLQGVLSDEFNYKIIGKFRQGKVPKTFEGSFTYDFPKKLRGLLDRRMADPDFDIQFQLVYVLALSETIDGSAGENVHFLSNTIVQYQVNKRNLTDLIT